MEKKTKIFTKPNEIRIKLKTDSLSLQYRRATFYFGNKVVNKLFTKKELKEGARVLISVINTSILIEKARKNEGIKLFLQGNGTLGIYKFQASLYGELINKLPDLKVKDFEVTKVMHENRMIRVNLDCSELDAKTIKEVATKTDKDIKLPTKRELAPNGAEIRLKINEYKKTFRLYFTKETYNNFILKNGIPGRVNFIFVPATSKSNAFISMIRVEGENPTKGNKVVKVASYTVQGVIPSNFDITGINTENHIVKYKHIIEGDTSFINIYPEFKYSTNNLVPCIPSQQKEVLEEKITITKDDVSKKYIEVLYKKIEQLESDIDKLQRHSICFIKNSEVYKLFSKLEDKINKLDLKQKDLISEYTKLEENSVNKVLKKVENKIIQTTRSDAINLNEEIDKITQEHSRINTKIRVVNELLQKVSSDIKEKQKQESKSFLKGLRKFFS